MVDAVDVAGTVEGEVDTMAKHKNWQDSSNLDRLAAQVSASISGQSGEQSEGQSEDTQSAQSAQSADNTSKIVNAGDSAGSADEMAVSAQTLTETPSSSPEQAELGIPVGAALSNTLTEPQLASPTPPAPPASADLADFVANLTQEQLAKVRALASAKGISTGPRKGRNGGVVIEIELPAEVVEPLATWAEEAGDTFEVFVNKIAADAITNYCFGDWSAVRPAEPVTAGAAASASAGATTTATTTAS